MSPLISQGMKSLGQYEITFPSIRRINQTEANTTETQQARMLLRLHQMADSEQQESYSRVKVDKFTSTAVIISVSIIMYVFSREMSAIR